MPGSEENIASAWKKSVGQTRFSPHASPRQIEDAISWSRRDFLRTASGGAVAAALSAFSPLRAMAVRKAQKAVVVTFGGGTRDEETFMPDGRENIPHLLNEFIPQGTIFTQVVNRGILGHYVATASLVTGVYETFNNFAAVSPQNPTVFEYFRKQLGRPPQDAWVVAPSNGFGLIGESSHASHGAGLGAGVILPKRLLAAAMSTGEAAGYDHLLRDNYESAGWQGFWVLMLTLTAIACYAVSLAPVTWVLITELFPNNARATAVSISVAALWLSSFALTYTFPFFTAAFGTSGTFLLYGSVCLLGFVFVYFRVPETKGQSLEHASRSNM